MLFSQILFLLALNAWAVPPCVPDTSPGTICRQVLATIRPTQFAVGRMEVNEKRERLARATGLETEDRLKKHPIEGVIGPGGSFFATDGHHFALAAYELGVQSVHAKILANYSGLSESQFWQAMGERGWVFPYRLGVGPLPPELLPSSLGDLIDDPYRSLASTIRKRGGFSKHPTHEAEFRWVEFFRQHIDLSDDVKAFQRAVRVGYRLARSQNARHLLGFISPNECEMYLYKRDQKIYDSPSPQI